MECACRNKKKKGKKATGVEAKFGKLIKDDKGNILYRLINMGYGMFMIVKEFTGKILWVGSCSMLMFMIPMAFEIFKEQQKVMMKIQMNEMMSGMTEQASQGGGAVMHSF